LTSILGYINSIDDPNPIATKQPVRGLILIELSYAHAGFERGLILIELSYAHAGFER
jgi:hypothetical protein